MIRNRLGRVIAAACAMAGLCGAQATHAQTGQRLPAYFSPGLPPNSGGGGCPALPAPGPSIPTRWFQQTTPPDQADTCQTFAFTPLTDASIQAVGSFSRSTWSGGLWPRIWALRGPRPRNLPFGDPGSNPVYPYVDTPTCSRPGGPPNPTMYLGMDYSSVAKANAATKAEILRMLGASTNVWQAPLLAQGFDPNSDFVRYSLLAADSDRFVNYSMGCNSHDGKSYVVIDKFVVHDIAGWIYTAQSTPPTGVMIDYEVNDFRSPADGALFLVDLAKSIHSQVVRGVHPQTFLYTNPWQYVPLTHGYTGGMTANGFDFSTIDQVKGAFDLMSLYLLDEHATCTVLPSFVTEMINLAGISGVVDTAKLVVLVDLYRCNEHDAIDIYNLNEAQKFGGYAIFPKNTTMGGRTTPLSGANLMLWRLLYGTKAPP